MNTIITIIIIIIIISNAIAPMAPDIMGTSIELAFVVVLAVLMVLVLATVEALLVVMLVWYEVITSDDSSLKIAAVYEDNTNDK